MSSSAFHEAAALGASAETASSTLSVPLETADASGAPVLTHVQVPLVLHAPRLDAPTDPHVDLPAHLRQCGLAAEADEFERSRVTCDFALCAFLLVHAHAGVSADMLMSAQVVSDAGEQLMMAIESVLRQREQYIVEQIERFAASTGAALAPGELVLPPEIQLDSLDSLAGDTPHMLFPLTGAPSPLPTHLVALCPDHGRIARPLVPTALGRPAYVVDMASVVLVPVHWLVYVLQCAHLPAYVPPSMAAAAALPSVAAATLACGTSVPIVVLPVVCPQHWSIIHRWLYTQDTGKLLASLLPLDYVVQCVRMQCGPSQLSPVPMLTQEAAIDALARLGVGALLQLVLRIRATWQNARNIGIYAHAFWKTLGDAWVLVVAAILVRKSRAPPHAHVPYSA